MNEKLLLNESPLIILPTLASIIGRNEGVILQQIHYWLLRSKNIRQERKWVYFTYDELAKQISFISKSTIRRAISKLEKNGFLTSGNFNKMKMDHTKWYSINYEKLFELLGDENELLHDVVEETKIPQPYLEESICPNKADDVLKVDSPSVQTEQVMCSTWTDDMTNMNRAIPEITTEITTENTSEISSSKRASEHEDEKDPYRFFEKNGFGTVGPFYAKKIKSWGLALSNELVIEAMKAALENGSKRWNYVETVLKDWNTKGYQSVEEIHDAQITYKTTKQQPYSKPIRKEYIPEWLHQEIQIDRPMYNLNFEEKKRLFEQRLENIQDNF